MVTHVCSNAFGKVELQITGTDAKLFINGEFKMYLGILELFDSVINELGTQILSSKNISGLNRRICGARAARLYDTMYIDIQEQLITKK